MKKALGIVRKIDDLGRIVIPKEVRDTQGWKSGQSMEMFMDEDGLVLHPYKSEYNMQEIINELETVFQHTNNETVSSIVEKSIALIKDVM